MLNFAPWMDFDQTCVDTRGWTGGRGYGDRGCGIGGRGCGIGDRGGGKREKRGREEGPLWAGVWKDWRAKLLCFTTKFLKNDS